MCRDTFKELQRFQLNSHNDPLFPGTHTHSMFLLYYTDYFVDFVNIGFIIGRVYIH